MQNIDLIYAAGPAIITAVCLFLLVFWRSKRRLSRNALLYSLIAYSSAIAIKYIVQLLSFNAYNSLAGHNTVALGFYYGIQTAFLEGGIAILVAKFATGNGRLNSDDAEGYGLGLAFWENGVLLGIISLLVYFAYYTILSSGLQQAQTVYQILIAKQPELFYPLSKAIPLVAYSVLERTSSIMAHFSWGLLAIFAVIYRKRLFVPLIFISGFMMDFLVPFSNILSFEVEELLAFCISSLSLLSAFLAIKLMGINELKRQSND
jgi:hypothetical protein